MTLQKFLNVPKRQLDIPELLAEIAAEEAPTPQEIEAFCMGCGSLNLPCLYRKTWNSSDGLLGVCPSLREKL